MFSNDKWLRIVYDWLIALSILLLLLFLVIGLLAVSYVTGFVFLLGIILIILPNFLKYKNIYILFKNICKNIFISLEDFICSIHIPPGFSSTFLILSVGLLSSLFFLFFLTANPQNNIRIKTTKNYIDLSGQKKDNHSFVIKIEKIGHERVFNLYLSLLRKEISIPFFSEWLYGSKKEEKIETLIADRLANIYPPLYSLEEGNWRKGKNWNFIPIRPTVVNLNFPLINSYQLKIKPITNNRQINLNKFDIIEKIGLNSTDIYLPELSNENDQALQEGENLERVQDPYELKSSAFSISRSPLSENQSTITIKEAFKKYIKQGLLDLTKPIKNQVVSKNLGFILKELNITPLNINSDGDLMVVMNGSILKIKLCINSCPNSNIKLYDFPLGSFYQAKGADIKKRVPYLDRETIEWSIEDLEDGVKLAYIATPFNHPRRFIEPLLGFFYINRWFILVSGLFITAIYSKALFKPLINIKNQARAESKTMNNIKDKSRNLNISSGTVNAIGAGALSLGNISGTVANTINQLSPSSNPEEQGIKDLLNQLQEAIDDPKLSEDDKKQSLEQLQILAETAQNPKDETMQKKAKRAVGFLKVIAEGVEPATKLAQACVKVLPKILAFFGL